jgi:hypothetical protein
MAQHQVNLTALPSAQTTVAPFKVLELNPRLNARDQTQQASLWFAPEDVIVLVA